MPDPAVAVALLLLVVLVEGSPLVRLPIGLLLAIALLASGASLLAVSLIGAAGVAFARLWLAMAARRGRDAFASASPAARAQREALRRRLAGSPTYARMTFLLAALPGVPAGFVFPMLGAMRAPLWPALAGTFLGRLPIYALTAALFAWLGRLGDASDREAALTLGMLALLLLVIRALALVDWRERAATGRIRLRNPDEQAARLTTVFAPPGPAGQASDPDVVEGEVLGEEHDPDDARDSALPPGGRSGS